VGFDEYLIKLSDAVNSPEYDRLLENERVLETLYGQAFEGWCYWVCSWSTLDIGPGEEDEKNFLAGFLGIQIPSKQIIRYGQKQKDGTATLTMKSIITATDSLSSIKSLLPQIEESHPSLFDELNSINSASRVITVEALVYPDILRPIKVKVFEESKILSATGDSNIKSESREYSFEWD